MNLTESQKKSARMWFAEVLKCGFWLVALSSVCAFEVTKVPPTKVAQSCQPDKLTVYKVILHTFWTRDKFPKHYPDWRPPAQWSKLIGVILKSRKRNAENMKNRTEARFQGTSAKHVLFNQGSVVETWPIQTSVSRQNQFSSSTSSEPRDAGISNPEWAKASPGFQVGIYGWRKRCLYFLIVGLLVMVIINLALTLWVLKVMEFSSEGMGQMRIIPGGLQLSGQAVVLDALIASNIRSRKGQPISIESSRNFTVTTRDSAGKVSSRIVLDKDKLECFSKSFQVLDTKGSVLFSANDEEVVVGADMLRVTGEGGAVFDGSVQTPLIRAASGSELKLESPTRSLEMKAPLGVAIESRAGDISASCLTDLKLQSLDGAIRLDSENVFFSKLKKVNPTPDGKSRSNRNEFNPRQTSLGVSYDIYQLCACENGRLFLAPPYGLCAAEDNTICR